VKSEARVPARPASSVIWDELRREQQVWREQALRGIAWSLALVCALTGLWYVVFPNPVPHLAWVLALAGALLVVVAQAPTIPFWLRSSAVLAAIYVPCLYALTVGGFAPNPLLGLGAIVVIATLLLGRSTGLAVLALSLFSIVGVSIGHRSGALTRAEGWVQNLDSASVPVALRVALIFGLLTITLVVAVSYLLNRAEELLVAKASALEILRSEQAEKERIMRDLELRELALQKARELELLGRLAGTMAHDFNNALLVVWIALDEIAQLPGVPASAAEPLGAIRAASDQAAASTRQLRAFGPMGPRRDAEVQLAPLIEKATGMFARVLPQNIRLRADFARDAVIVADEGEVLRVLMNLALNARDAMREGGDLTLRVRAPAEAEKPPGAATDFVVIDVSDTGSGMSDEVKGRMFEPFFTTKDASGTGLGLASVRDIAEAHGGRVSVTSEVDRGTTISIAWPAVVQPSMHAETPTPAPKVRPAVVLLVDDDAAVRLALTRGLTRLGMTVLEAPDGAAAMLAARRHQGVIDVLCTDCVMAGLPVRQLIASFRELHQGRVIVCSGYAPSETGLSADLFDDFLPKPFSIEQLSKRITALLS
jgi:signal transduction histidine kinase/CheY-like chemotaxis protein